MATDQLIMSKEIEKLAYMPLKQQSNRVWRTYEGGALIDRWKLSESEQDTNEPEEWIMSTITARGNGRPADEGLSILVSPEGTISLKELVQSNPSLFLGEFLAKKYGTTGVLIKMLDSKERLTIQVHPDKAFAKEYLQSDFGKTESWYILGGRQINGEPSAIYMGFKEGVTPQQWQKLFLDQDTEGMLECLHKFEVQPGDAFMIYGGVPHAIGSGCFLMEVQEPTDYTMRVERVTPGGLTISDELIHQGVGVENMLQCFHYETISAEEARNKWMVSPEVLQSSDEFEFKTIFNKSHTACFGLNELDLTGSFKLDTPDSFFVGVVYEGQGSISCNGGNTSYAQGDEIFFPAAIQDVEFKAESKSKILLCYPPTE